MRSAVTPAFYPEDCNADGTDCLQCVRTTAEAMRELTFEPTREWASAAFHRLYSHPACRHLEHSFVWACGAEQWVCPEPEAEPLLPSLVQIRVATA